MHDGVTTCVCVRVCTRASAPHQLTSCFDVSGCVGVNFQKNEQSAEP
jgi:hypothetical protein